MADPIYSHIQKMWADALVSGKYKQGAGRLRGADGRYCCLGVLCDLFIENNPGKARWIGTEKTKGIVTFEFEGGHDYFLPSLLVQRWAGMDYSDGRLGSLNALPPDRAAELMVAIETSKRKLSLSALNDVGATFEEVSTVILAMPLRTAA